MTVTWASSSKTWSSSTTLWGPSDRDSMLNLLSSEYALSYDQRVIGQWNMNNYFRPAIYGSLHGTASGTSLPYSKDASVYNVTLSDDTTQTVTTISTSFNSTNIVRIMFDAMIVNTTVGVTEDVSEFIIELIPRSGGSSLTELTDMVSLSLSESFTKNEIFFVTNHSDTRIDFDSIIMKVKPVDDVTGGTVSLRFKNICAARVYKSEMTEYQNERLRDVFEPQRPGDQLLENGLLSGSVSPVTKYHVVSSRFNDNYNRPEFLHTFLSPFNEDICYMSPKFPNNNNRQNIFVEYDDYMKINQIYIKTQNFRGYRYQNVVTSLQGIDVYLRLSSGWQKVYSTTNSSEVESGCIILQYNGSASSWQLGIDDSSLPRISSANGQFESASDFVSMRGIHVAYTTATANKDSDIRLRAVEISPRLALDLSNFLVSTKANNSFDNADGPVPAGLAAVGTGQVMLENLPRSYSGSTFQIFDNNAFSPLNKLIKSDVKFTIYTSLTNTKTLESYTVKTATMYAEEWNLKSLETADVSLNDYGRYLQNRNCPDLLLTNNHQPKRAGTVAKSVEALLQLSGFSDYDIASLKRVSDKVAYRERGRIPIFFCREEDKVWDTLSDLLLGYQISAYFDENGILNFRDIMRDTASYTSYSNSSSYFSLTNTGMSNIVNFDMTKKPSVGELTVSYRPMSITNNIYDGDGNIFDKEKMKVEGRYYRKESNSSNIPYSPSENKALICVNVIDDVGRRDTRIRVGDFNHIDKREPRFVTGFNGYGVIEGEVIAWDGLEYSFTPVDGFKSLEVIRSREELEDAIAERFNAIVSKPYITKYSFARNSVTKLPTPIVSASYDSPHKLKAGQVVSLEIYDTPQQRLMFDGNAKVEYVQDSTTVGFRSQQWANKSSLLYPSSSLTQIVNVDTSTSLSGKGEQALNYTMTGYLCNVRRGLFGTYATNHYSNNVYDSSAFITSSENSPTAYPIASVQLGRKLERKVEADNATNFVIPVSKNRTTYLGFYGRDRSPYEEYHFTILPTNNLDTFGIFFGASPTVTTVSGVSTVTMGAGTGGVFIEIFSSSFKQSGGFGAVIRQGPKRDSNYLFVSEDKFLYDTWRRPTYKWVKLKDKDGKYIKDENGNIKKVKKKILHPPKQNKIVLRFFDADASGVSRFGVKVNGKWLEFYRKSASIPAGGDKFATTKIPLDLQGPNWSSKMRDSATFGVFAFNGDNPKTSINIQEIYAGPSGATIDTLMSWSDINAGQNVRVDELIGYVKGSRTRLRTDVNGYKNPTRPFVLRATPIIRGIEISDVKWDGDLPFYDLQIQDISGKLGAQVVESNSVAESVVIGTPFRGRYALKNKMDEVVYTKADSETYIDAKVYGKSINMLADRKIVRKIDDNPGLSKLEIDIPWCPGEATAQNVADTVLDRSKKMNTCYDIEIFGNPALRLGDYVKVTYEEKNLSNAPMIITSVDNNFSNGGISTSLKLRDANWA